VAAPRPPELKGWLLVTVFVAAFAMTVSSLVSTYKTGNKKHPDTPVATQCRNASALETRRCFVIGKSDRFKNARDGALPGDQMQICSNGGVLKRVVEGGTAYFWFETEKKDGEEVEYRLFPAADKCPPLTL